jgi:hypothetical protein
MAAMLVVNPRNDEDFVRFVQQQARSVESASELQARLRPRHPQVVVRPRELDGERTDVWYVYRDGHWRGA